MNKHERHLKKITKYKKRLLNYCLKNKDGKFHSLKTTGKPCSCFMCSPYKFRKDDRNKLKQQFLKEIKNND